MVDKRMAGDYEIIQSMMIGDKEIVLGENPKDTGGLPYMCAFCEDNGIVARFYDAVGGDDFCEIAQGKAGRGNKAGAFERVCRAGRQQRHHCRAM